MLLYFEIKNCRSFDEKGIHFSLLATDRCKDKEGQENLPNHLIPVPKYKVNVLKTAAICGANASGKSNVINCLFDAINIIEYSFTGAYPNKNYLTDDFSSRILGKNVTIPYFPNKNALKNIGKPITFTLGLLIDEVHFEYSFSYNHERILSEYLWEYSDNATEIKHFNRQYNEKTKKYDYSDLSQYFSNTHVHQGITKGSSLFLSAIHQFAENDTYKIDFVANILKNISNIAILTNVEENLIHLANSLYYLQSQNLLNVIANDLQNIDFLISKIEAYFEENSLEKVTSFHGNIDFDFIKEESQGTQTFVKWLFYMKDTLATGKTLFIDEFGTYMHPLLSRYFIQLFYDNNPNNAQLIFATHDIKLMDRRYTRDDQVFLINRSDAGDSSLKRLSDYEIDDKYIILDNLYLQGAFGAIPNIKS